tara:strand:+ start:491 stop:847 length:357 start_codon:yes stop_codon:yes gene_type:complete
MKKVFFLLIVVSFSFLLVSCNNGSVSQFKETCQKEYIYFPDAEDCLERKFMEVAIKQDDSNVLQAIHANIISILKQKVYETKMANSDAWFEYNDMFRNFSISKDKKEILESYHQILIN